VVLLARMAMTIPKTPPAATPGIMAAMATAILKMPPVAEPVAGTVQVTTVVVWMVPNKPAMPVLVATGVLLFSSTATIANAHHCHYRSGHVSGLPAMYVIITRSADWLAVAVPATAVADHCHKHSRFPKMRLWPEMLGTRTGNWLAGAEIRSSRTDFAFEFRYKTAWFSASQAKFRSTTGVLWIYAVG
jgi:hypothetical protein